MAAKLRVCARVADPQLLSMPILNVPIRHTLISRPMWIGFRQPLKKSLSIRSSLLYSGKEYSHSDCDICHTFNNPLISASNHVGASSLRGLVNFVVNVHNPIYFYIQYATSSETRPW